MMFIKSKHKTRHLGQTKHISSWLLYLLTYLSTSSFHNRYKQELSCLIFCGFQPEVLSSLFLSSLLLALVPFFSFPFSFYLFLVCLIICLFFISLCFTLFQPWTFMASAQKGDCCHPLPDSFSGIAEWIKWTRTFAYTMNLFSSFRSAMFLPKEFQVSK